MRGLAGSGGAAGGLPCACGLPTRAPAAPRPPPARRGAADWYWALPPITRGLLTLYIATGLAAYLGVLPLMQLYHAWGLELKLWVPQVRAAGLLACS